MTMSYFYLLKWLIIPIRDGELLNRLFGDGDMDGENSLNNFVGVNSGDLDAVRLFKGCRFSPSSHVTFIRVTCADLDWSKLLGEWRFSSFLLVSLVRVTGDRFLSFWDDLHLKEQTKD